MFRRKAEKRSSFRPFPLREETGCLLNPYRGFYAICRMYADSLILEEKNIPVTQYIPPREHTLVLLEVNLQPGIFPGRRWRTSARPLSTSPR